MNIKGIQYIPKPLARVASRTAPRNRAQVLSELASLQRQEERLDKKLIVWCNNQRQTERQLRQVQERRAFLERVLDQKDTQRRSPSAERKSEHGGGREAATQRESPPTSPELESEAQTEPWKRQPPIALERRRLGRRTTR